MPYRYPFFKMLLGRWLTRLYFRRIAFVRRLPSPSVPTLYLISHRNGAADGWVMLHALGRVPSLISVQLLKHPLLRPFFAGIAVLRGKDRARYGADIPPSPVQQALAQLQAGGSLCLYPEGSSEWGYAPLPYQKGMAVICAKLKAKKVVFAVQPVGLFYSAPDRFRSRVSLLFGEHFLPQGGTVADLQAELSRALDAVSVCCADGDEFARRQQLAFQAARRGEDFGEAFLAADPAAFRGNTAAVNRFAAQTALLLACPLPVIAAYCAGRCADARNTVCFFRLLAAAYALPLQILLYLFYPLPVLLGALVLGGAALLFFPEPPPRERA